MGTETKVWYQDKDHAVATCGALMLAQWRGERTYANWRIESTPIFRHLQNVSPKGCLVLIVCEDKAIAPDAKARAEVDNLARERVNQVKGSAILAYGSSLRLASIRALATAINIFGKSQMRVFTTPADAMLCLAQASLKADVPFDLEATTTLLNNIRAPK